MFDELPATKRPAARNKSRALGAAIAFHATAIAVVAATSVLAVDSIEPPSIIPPFHGPGIPVMLGDPDGGAHKPPARRIRSKPAPPDRKVFQPTGPVEPHTPSPGGPETPAPADADGTRGDPRGTPDGSDEVVGPPGDGHIAEQPAPLDEILKVGGEVQAPIVQNQVAPRYPELAKAARVQGMVVLEAVINTAGQVEDIHVLQGHPLLNDAALAAARQWTFLPGRLNGKPVRVYFSLTVNFALR
jgi:protein TonB